MKITNNNHQYLLNICISSFKSDFFILKLNIVCVRVLVMLKYRQLKNKGDDFLWLREQKQF